MGTNNKKRAGPIDLSTTDSLFALRDVYASLGWRSSSRRSVSTVHVGHPQPRKS
jgi:hypothetical protein